MFVFKNKFGSFETIAKSKDKDGNEIKYYMPVSFRKDREPVVDKIDIICLEWWLSCFNSSTGVRPKLFINQWRQSDRQIEQKPSDVEVNTNANEVFDDFETFEPFY